ncbi:putative trypsin-6 [Drosophila ficusphila]|uniref:putative trypsin-6 n=1 Tax=Drosophila ficusphila TaxID=30025 RepID=UPI0007E8A6F4|nr:putative trypsin-6 [Drosophila ficusphila]
MQCLLFLWLLSYVAHSSVKGHETAITVGRRYHQNVVSIRTTRHIRSWGDNHFCVGSIVATRWVLTTGCCVSTLPKSTPNQATSRRNLRVVVFAQRRLMKPPPRNIFKVDEVVLDTESDVGCSNLAMLKLNRAVTGDRFAVHLPHNEMNSTWLCQTVGWGRIYYNGPYVNELLQLKSQRSSTTACKEYCSKCICMGSYSGRGNMCQMDMGSPLYCGHYIYGVAGKSHHCEDQNILVYSSIYHHRDFIESTLSAAHSQRKSKRDLIVLALMLNWFWTACFGWLLEQLK